MEKIIKITIPGSQVVGKENFSKDLFSKIKPSLIFINEDGILKFIYSEQCIETAKCGKRHRNILFETRNKIANIFDSRVITAKNLDVISKIQFFIEDEIKNCYISKFDFELNFIDDQFSSINAIEHSDLNVETLVEEVKSSVNVFLMKI